MAVPLWSAAPAAAAPGGGWSVPQDLKSSSWAYSTDVCSDGLGNAMAVYTTYDGVSTNVAFARRYVSGLGWQPEVALSSGGWAYLISVACNKYGDAAAAWSFWNGSAYSVQIARYAADWGWSAVKTPSPMNGNTYELDVAIDGTGSAYVVTYTDSGSGYQVRGARLGPDNVLDAAIRLDNGTSVPNPAIVKASAAAGAVVIWVSNNGTNNDVYSVRNNGTAWQVRRSVELRGGNAVEATVGLDDAGNALAVWRQDVFGYYLWFATSSPGSAWSAPQYTQSDGYRMALAVAPGGAAVMTSIQWNGSAYALSASRYTPGYGFSARVVSSNAVYDYQLTQIALDSAGDAMVEFHASGSGYYAVRAALFAGNTWQAASWVDIEPLAKYGHEFAIAMLKDGRSIATWVTDDFSTAAYPRANIFRALDTSAPWVRLAGPFNGAVLPTPYVTVTGWTEPGASVSVSGFAGTVFASGYFQFAVPILEGGNWLLASATDAAGNTGYSNYVYVTYTNPQRLLDAERAQAGRTGFQDVMNVESVNYGSGWWPQMETDRNGNAFNLWYETVNGADHAYVNRYTNGTGWGTPIELQAEEGNLWGAPRMALDAGGNLSILWVIYDYAGNWAHVWVEFYTVVYGWDGPYRVDSAERFAFWPDTGVNPATVRHFLVWQQRDENTGNYSIYGRYFSASGYFWTGPARIETAVGSNDLPRIAFDVAGHGYTSFRNNNGTAVNLAMARWNGASWNGTQILQAVPTIQWNAPLAVDAGGNVTIAWENYTTVTNFLAGRYYSNETWSGQTLVWADSWNWDPEVLADNSGRAFIAFTATVSGQASAYVSVALAGRAPGAAVAVDQTYADGAGGPKLSTGWGGSPVRVHFDEYVNGSWRPLMREYNMGNDTWNPIVSLGGAQPGHIPDMAPMPDGGFWATYMEENATLGISQTVARRFVPLDLTPPTLSITTPINGATVNTSYVEVRGLAEVGARVWVNNIELAVAPNGSFAVVVPLMNGSNLITARAQDINGNIQNRTVNVTFADPARALIDSLTAQNQALQNQLNLTNSTLWAALAGQNSSLLAQIAATNATLAAAIAAGDSALLAQLLAQNASLIQAIGTLNATLLAQLAAGDAALTAQIAATNASLLAQLAAGDAALTAQIAATNASLLAKLAAQNSALLADIASTNATLFSKLAAVNSSLVNALAAQDAALLASIAAGDAALTAQIGATNASLLASLAAQNATLRGLIADTNLTLLASLAAQNGDLLARIGATNATLLAQLAATNATLWAKLTADGGALWDGINATARTSAETNTAQNTTLATTQSELENARAAAASAGTLAMVGLLLGLVGIAVAGLAIVMSRKRPPQMPQVDGHTPPPRVEGVEVVDVVEVKPSAPNHGHSMGAEGEIPSGAETEQGHAQG